MSKPAVCAEHNLMKSQIADAVEEKVFKIVNVFGEMIDNRLAQITESNKENKCIAIEAKEASELAQSTMNIIAPQITAINKILYDNGRPGLVSKVKDLKWLLIIVIILSGISGYPQIFSLMKVVISLI